MNINEVTNAQAEVTWSIGCSLLVVVVVEVKYWLKRNAYGDTSASQNGKSASSVL